MYFFLIFPRDNFENLISFWLFYRLLLSFVWGGLTNNSFSVIVVLALELELAMACDRGPSSEEYNLHLKWFPRFCLHLLLAPVQPWEFECGLYKYLCNHEVIAQLVIACHSSPELDVISSILGGSIILWNVPLILVARALNIHKIKKWQSERRKVRTVGLIQYLYRP